MTEHFRRGRLERYLTAAATFSRVLRGRVRGPQQQLKMWDATTRAMLFRLRKERDEARKAWLASSDSGA